MKTTEVTQGISATILRLKDYAKKEDLTSCMRERIEAEIESLAKLHTAIKTHSKAMEILRLEAQVRKLKAEVDSEQLP